MNKGAILSEDKKYRYQLWREWDDDAPKVAIVGLNPSTADHEVDDPTVTRCIDFAKNWGYGGFYMVNLFAFRATDPNDLVSQIDPIGTENDSHLQDIFSRVDKVVCAWGNGGTFQSRNTEVLKFIKQPYCLQKNAGGEPAHPLYLKKSIEPILLFEPTSEYANVKKLIAVKPETNPFEPNPSKHIFFTYRPERDKIKYAHRLKHFTPDEFLELTLHVTDGKTIFNQSDELIVGQNVVYWYISRVGEFYTKSNGEFDAEHIGDEFIIKVSDIKTWKAVFIDELCYLELQTNADEFYRSVDLPEAEHEHLLSIQKALNRLTKANR